MTAGEKECMLLVRMRRKCGNPMWGMPAGSYSSCGYRIRVAGATAGSHEENLHRFSQAENLVRKHKNRCYTPEGLLKEWRITVDACDVATRRPDAARSKVVSFGQTPKAQWAKKKRSARVFHREARTAQSFSPFASVLGRRRNGVKLARFICLALRLFVRFLQGDGTTACA